MKKLKIVTMMSAVVLTVGLGIVSQQATAATVDRCGEEIDERPVVVAVHGLWGSPAAWSDLGLVGSMNDSIKLIRGVNLVEAFNYEAYHSKWVTDEHIGKALAERINCLSAASREAGGDGRVVVVAHSMGGLALREALNRTNPVYVKPENIGLAVMIGTPHKGAPVAKWCNPTGCGWVQPAVAAMRPGSRQLRELPELPPTVPQRAVAGRIIGYSGFGLDDGVVSVYSATRERTTAYAGDGLFETRCYQLWPWQKPSCHHENLLKDAGVQANVMAALNEYVRSLPNPDPSPSPTRTCTASPSPTPSGGEIGGTGENAGTIVGAGGEPSATPAEPSPTPTPSEPVCV